MNKKVDKPPTPKGNKRSRKTRIQSLKASDPEKYSIIEEIRQDLVEGKHLQSMADLRQFAFLNELSIGNASSRKAAIPSFLISLSELPTCKVASLQDSIKKFKSGKQNLESWRKAIVKSALPSKQTRSLETSLSSESIDKLAIVIDNASDDGDTNLLLQLEKRCEDLIKNSKDKERVKLRYFQANAVKGITRSRRSSQESSWDFEKTNRVKYLLLLRQALADPEFQTAEQVVQFQIRTNLAYALLDLNRPVAANEQCLDILSVYPHFAKALLCQSFSIQQIALSIYDLGHQNVLMAHVLSLLDQSMDREAFWESGDREYYVSQIETRRSWIRESLTAAGYDPTFDLDDFNLGDTEEECKYRKWCLHERLFINPMNESLTKNFAARDVFHLPSHSYKIQDVSRFPVYFNLLKQEYVSARYRLFIAIHNSSPDFIMREVLMLDGGENQVLGHQTEELRSAYRSLYSIFDKIGVFLNSYLNLGLKTKKVQFRHIWFQKQNNQSHQFHPIFKKSQNWALEGLFFLSKDLYDDTFQETAEPDAAKLNQLRNQVEHRFLILQQLPNATPRGDQWTISVKEFQFKTLRLLKLAREALFYLSITMCLEEQEKENKRDDTIRVVHKAKPIDPISKLEDL